MKKLIIIILASVSFQFGFAQDMQKGFEYLETGNFAKAEIFFEKILEEAPENKTAIICYGRAVGLNGNPEKATELFTGLQKDYPNDLEVELNYCESLLWSKQFQKAKESYAVLVQQYPDNFSAALGFANTFSNLKDYESAMLYVNKALEIQPENASAKTSLKYIRLGHAYKMQQSQQYARAETFLLENLVDFPGDKETLLNLANLYLIIKATDKAIETYRQIAVNEKDSITALNGMALASHIAEKDKTALGFSLMAVEKVKAVNDTLLLQNTTERYIQALIWNRKFALAEQNIQKNIEEHGNKNWVLALRATLGMYTSNIKQSISDYNTILESDSASFDGNLGVANAYYANGEIKKAYKALDQTLQVFENQKDAVGFMKKLDYSFTPYVIEKLSYSFDNGKNVAYTSRTTAMFPVSTQLSFIAAYQLRITENSQTVKRATTNDFELGVQYHFHPKIILNAQGGVSSANSFNNDYNQFVADLSFKIKPFRLQDLQVGYKKELQNYNADLIDSQIETNHFYANYNLSTNFKLGWFTQLYYTNMSDGNARNLLFTSLYYNFLSKPVLKGGLNYQNIGFREQMPEMYFSPEKFNAVEIFFDLMKNIDMADGKGVFYSITAATGFQFIEQGPRQSTYRVQAKLGYKSSDRLVINLFGNQSNIASATASGYTSTEFGINVKWMLTKQPIFKKR